MRIVVGLLALCLTVCLGGCYMSDAPLLDDADAAHALPIAEKLIGLNDGGLVFKADGTLDETYLAWTGNAYADPTQQNPTLITLHPLAGHEDTYIVQQVTPSGTLYFLATLAGGGTRAAIRSVDEAGEAQLADKMQQLRAVAQGFDSKGPAYKVAERSQLLDGAAFEAGLPGHDAYRYLVVRYLAIPPDKQGLPEAHDSNDASGFSPAYWYTEGRSAEHGVANAQVDLAKAAAYYRKAAEAGIAGAMTDYGRMLESGSGVTANAVEAIGWYKKAVELGNADAMLALGKALLNGAGIEKDAARGAYAIRMASASGNVDAMKTLADLLDKGDLIAADREERLFWLVKAAEAGDRDAIGQVAMAIRAGDGIAPSADLAALWLARFPQSAPPAGAPMLSALTSTEYVLLPAQARHYFMMGFLDMLWSLGERLTPDGFNGDCAEGYAMDNVSDTANGLTASMAEFADAHPDGNVSGMIADYVYSHCDTRRNLLLLDFYVLNFSGALAMSDTDFENFAWGALSGAVEAHLSASKTRVASCIENVYDEDDAYEDLMKRMVGGDLDLVTNIMMQKLDVICPP
jgi:TPR repeat protein